MGKYRKKPVIVDAVKYDKDHIGKALDFCDDMKYDPATNTYFIRTLEGDMDIYDGDYIIKGVNGEFYPCKPDVFKMTYEPILR